MTTILITAIGGDIAQGVAQIVRRVRPNWRIVGVDIHEQHGGTLFVDEFETVPPATDPDYLTRIESVVERCGVTCCLPMSEAELAFALHRGLRAFGSAPLIAANPQALEIGLDKLATARFLAASGCPAPWTVCAEAGIEPPAYPCIFKPRRGAGSKGISVCSNREDAEYLVRRYPNAIFQELLEPADREVTCAIYRTRDGRTAVLPMLRKLVGGFTGWAKVVDVPDAIAQCVRLADALDLHGAINAQMRLTEAGPRIFEINSRLSSTVFIRHLMGFTDVAWLLDELEGKQVVFPPLPIGAVAVRVQGAAMMQVANSGMCLQS